MLCSDLERYLEAYLDGRLGRSRTTILRRHLGMCGPCRARMERLRRFERELGRQIGARADQEQPSVWQGLEIDLVRSFSVGGTDIIPFLRPLPPTAQRMRPAAARGQTIPARPQVPAATRRRLSRLAGVLAVALALGMIYEFARAWLNPADPAEAAMQTYLDFAAGKRDLALRTEDATSLQNWFTAQLGGAFPMPPVPEGFRLVGGARAQLAESDAAVIVYAPVDLADAGPTLLFVQPVDPLLTAGGEAVAPIPLEIAGYHQLAWEDEPYSFRLVSAEPPTRLRQFAPDAGS